MVEDRGSDRQGKQKNWKLGSRGSLLLPIIFGSMFQAGTGNFSSLYFSSRILGIRCNFLLTSNTSDFQLGFLTICSKLSKLFSYIKAVGRSPEGGHGNPFQYSCLENPMDRGAERATVHTVAKSQTQLKWCSIHTYQHFWLSTGFLIICRKLSKRFSCIFFSFKRYSTVSTKNKES